MRNRDVDFFFAGAYMGVVVSVLVFLLMLHMGGLR